MAEEFQEGDGVMSLYREERMNSAQELDMLLVYYFGGKNAVPRMGRLFSMIKLRQSSL